MKKYIYLTGLLFLTALELFAQGSPPDWNTAGNTINSTQWFGATSTSTIPLDIKHEALDQPIHFSTGGTLRAWIARANANTQATLNVRGMGSMSTLGWSKAIRISNYGALIWDKHPLQMNSNYYFMASPSTVPQGDILHGLVTTLDGTSTPQYVYRLYGMSRPNEPVEGVHRFLTTSLFDERIGVNTLFPSQRVEIVDDADVQLRLTNTQNTGTPSSSIYTDFQTTVDGHLLLNPSNAGSAGNVGINLTTGSPPTHTLDINGTLAVRTVNEDLTNSLNQVLVRDPNNNGRVMWRDASSIGGAGSVTADNGLTATSGHVQLGGSLVQNTNIDLDNFNLTFNYSPNNPNNVNNIGIGTTSPTATVHIVRHQTDQTAHPVALKIEHSDISGKDYATGLRLDITGSNTYNFGGWFVAQNASEKVWGIQGSAQGNNTTPITHGAAFFAANATEINYGVNVSVNSNNGTPKNYAGYFKSAATTGENYGVYGEVVNTGTGQDWAGFFEGDIFYTGGIVPPSDSILKTNVQPLNGNLALLSNLNPVSFEFDQINYEFMNLASGTQYGLIAQHVEQVLPNLVAPARYPDQLDSLGNVIIPGFSFKTIDYQDLIPYLLGAVQELDSINQKKQEQIDTLTSRLNQLNTKHNQLNAKVNQLEAMINSCCNQNLQSKTDPNQSIGSVQEVELRSEDVVILNQNSPNPFAESTTITYHIPESYNDAKMIFFDHNGRVLKEMQITGRGNGSVKVYAEDLSAGTYLYSLVVDGQTIDTKKMTRVR